MRYGNGVKGLRIEGWERGGVEERKHVAVTGGERRRL